jgi:hypothetical protein
MSDRRAEKMHPEEFHNLCSSRNNRIITVIRVRWVGLAANMGKMRNAYTI